MKKMILCLSIIIMSGCVADPRLDTGNGNPGLNGIIQVYLDSGKGIVISSSEITNASLNLTGPDGAVQAATWVPGGPTSFNFNCSVSGSHTLAIRQVNTSNRVSQTNVSFGFTAGNNYFITITLGGQVFVQMNESSNVSSVSSAVSSAASSSSSSSSSVVSSSSSSYSSVSSISSSVSSSSSSVSSSSVSSIASSASSAPSETYGIYSETVPLNVVWHYTVEWVNDISLVKVTEQSNVVGEGIKAIQLTMGGSWIEHTAFVIPSYTFADMSSYSNGVISFMVKSSYWIGIGLRSGLFHEEYILLTNDTYGFNTNNVWCTVNVPVKVFTDAGINLSQISYYFSFFAQNTYGAYPGMPVGESVYIDNIYWYK